MPKLKTSKTTSKRIKKVTKNGLIIHRNMSAQHRMYGKNKKTKMRSAQTSTLSSANIKRMKKLISTK